MMKPHTKRLITGRRHAFAAGLIAVCMQAAACGLPSPLQVDEDKDIDNWLMCIECTDGELAALINLDTAETVAKLSLALSEGPPSYRVANIERQTIAYYAQFAEYAATDYRDTLIVSVGQYIDHYTGNFVATYQSRVIRALRRLNTPAARAALQEALDAAASGQVTYRTDVLADLRRAVVQ